VGDGGGELLKTEPSDWFEAALSIEPVEECKSFHKGATPSTSAGAAGSAGVRIETESSEICFFSGCCS
jgi:hypothetical protein